jgi:hypothetical protein
LCCIGQNKRKWRVTTQRGKLYIHGFEWPEKQALPCLDKTVKAVCFLNDFDKTNVPLGQTAVGIFIMLPKEVPDSVASVVCLELN